MLTIVVYLAYGFAILLAVRGLLSLMATERLIRQHAWLIGWQAEQQILAQQEAQDAQMRAMEAIEEAKAAANIVTPRPAATKPPATGGAGTPSTTGQKAA